MAEFYAITATIIAVIAAMIFFAAYCAHRVCKAYRWPRVISLAAALIYLFAVLAPFAIFGSQWGTFWFPLAIPFSVVLELTGAMGFPVYALVTSIVAASFWGTSLYVVSALILLVRKKRPV